MEHLQLTHLKTHDVQLYQPVEGYRFSVDSVLLADFVQLKKYDRVLDVGTGCGVIAIILAKRYPHCHFYAVEIQDELSNLAMINVKLNNLQNITVLHHDFNCPIKSIEPNTIDHLVANPPYREPRIGLLSDGDSDLIARHEVCLSLEELVGNSKRYLRYGGKISLVYPADLTSKLIYTLKSHNFEPKRMQFVHPRPGTKARLVLLEASLGAGVELLVLPPIFTHQ